MARWLPLKPNSIRLLQLDDIRDGEVCASLDVVALDSYTAHNRPTYNALSYVWGQEDQDHYEIILNGWATPVRRNLWSFLLQFRQKSQGQRLWIDALCIDQTNEVERSAQVSIMSEIYKCAEKVIVWLGLDYRGSGLVTVEDKSVFSRSNGLTTSVSNLEERMISWLNCEYWCRTWILQEFILAKKVELMCGSTVIDGTAMELFMVRRDVKHKDELGHCNYYQSPGWRLVSQRNQKSEAQSLVDLIIFNRESQCSEPRDRVFAMLGLCSERQAGKMFVVDYSMTIEQLIGEVLRFSEVIPKHMCRYARSIAAALGIDNRCMDIKRLNLSESKPHVSSRRATSRLSNRTSKHHPYEFDVDGCIVGRLSKIDALSNAEISYLETDQDAQFNFVNGFYHQFQAGVPGFSAFTQLNDAAQLERCTNLVKHSILEAINARSSSYTRKARNSFPPRFAHATLFLSGHVVQTHATALTYGSCSKGDRVVQFPGHDLGIVLSSEDPPRLVGTIVYAKSRYNERNSSQADAIFPRLQYGFIYSPAELKSPFTTIRIRMTAEELVEFVR